MSDWVGKTNFSRGQQDKTPTTWDLQCGLIEIVVTRHIHYLPDTWVLRCAPFWDTKELVAKDIEEAKAEAIQLVTAELEEVMAALLPHRKDGK